jgi:cell shape-determining protein MreC
VLKWKKGGEIKMASKAELYEENEELRKALAKMRDEIDELIGEEEEEEET